MKTTKRGMWRPLGAAAGVAAMALAASTIGTTPAVSALPAGDCAVPFPVADLVAGDAVTGLTVATGTTPDPFTGEVLGVLKDGIAPGLDMVMMRLTSPEIDRVGGIWQGMSGSPVYAETGELIGAVSYGLAFGPSPVAGVTPFEEMNDYLTTPAVKVRISGRVADAIAARTDVSRAEAAQGFAELPIPSGISGVRTARLGKTRGRDYLDKQMQSLAGGSSAVAGPETIVAGGNLAMTGSYGDITIGGVGTTTSVCNDQVVGFGHPAFFSGRTTAAMHPADAIYVQEDPTLVPFKVANIAAPAGTITGDHLTGITGLFGTVPDTTDVTSSVTYGSRSRTGSSEVSMADFAATTTFYEHVANHDRVIDGYGPGSEEYAWTIRGHESTGAPFMVDLSDRYRSTYDITYTSAWDVPDMVWQLQQFPGVVIDEVTMTSTVSDSTDRWKVATVQYRRGGVWRTVLPRGLVRARAGATLRMRAGLVDADGATRKVPVSTSIPGKLAGNAGVLYIVGGDEVWPDYYGAGSLAEFVKLTQKAVRNDEVVADLTVVKRRGETNHRAVSQAQDRVVTGHKRFKIIVN